MLKHQVKCGVPDKLWLIQVPSVLIEVLMIITYERYKGTVICNDRCRGRGTFGGVSDSFA